MPVTNYYTVNGQIIGESTNGVRTQYIRDALGSVIATTDGAGNIQNTYRYTPYGGTTYKTGTAPDPKFLFAGTWGGRQTGRAHSEEYWRARHRSEPETTWTTVDPLWPAQLPYGYASGSPVSNVDPFGRSAKSLPGGLWVTVEMSGANTSQCGAASFRVNWHLPHDVPNGWIVQHVTFRTSVWNCRTHRPVVQSIIEYWEGWEVFGSNIYEGFAEGGKGARGNTDTFFTTDYGACTYGTIVIEGAPKFLADSKYVQDPPWNLSNPFSGGLPSLDKPGPDGWTDNGALIHFLVVGWSCCSCVGEKDSCMYATVLA